MKWIAMIQEKVPKIRKKKNKKINCTIQSINYPIASKGRHSISMEMYHQCFENADKCFCHVCLNSFFTTKKCAKNGKSSLACLFIHFSLRQKMHMHTCLGFHQCAPVVQFSTSNYTQSAAKIDTFPQNQSKINNCCQMKCFSLSISLNVDRLIHSFIRPFTALDL